MPAWLDSGAYKAWRCEPEAHPPRTGSPHGANRVCSNETLSAAAAGTGEWPEGVAAVKELYDRVGGSITGIAVYLKTAPASDKGAGWYWYERLGTRIAADGLNVSGCTGCHSIAGTDPASTPSPGARDFVYTPVR